MKSSNMNILYLDFLYSIIGNLHRDRKEILMSEYQATISGQIPDIDDLYMLQMYEIMRMPVIWPEKAEKPRKALLRLKILCCSCSRGCLFLYLFSGEEWQIYYVNFNKSI